MRQLHKDMGGWKGWLGCAGMALLVLLVIFIVLVGAVMLNKLLQPKPQPECINITEQLQAGDIVQLESDICYEVVFTENEYIIKEFVRWELYTYREDGSARIVRMTEQNIFVWTERSFEGQTSYFVSLP
jgi:hypothetical protein